MSQSIRDNNLLFEIDMKLKGSVHFLRVELSHEKVLNDPEFRLFQVYRRICVWDKRSKYFGTSDIPIRDIKKLHLPSWSIGKISQTRASLVSKKWLEKISRTRYRIRDYQIIYSRYVRDIERAFQSVEPSVQNTEQIVQHIERRKRDIGVIPSSKTPEILNKSGIDVQLNEQDKVSKEIIKKDKEVIKKRDLKISSKGNSWNDEERLSRLKESARKKNKPP